MTGHHRGTGNHLSHVVLLCPAFIAAPVVAGEKPPVISDQPSPLTIVFGVSATVGAAGVDIEAAYQRMCMWPDFLPPLTGVHILF